MARKIRMFLSESSSSCFGFSSLANFAPLREINVFDFLCARSISLFSSAKRQGCILDFGPTAWKIGMLEHWNDGGMDPVSIPIFHYSRIPPPLAY
jgi:hypothetical protein